MDLDLVFALPSGKYLKPGSISAKFCLLAKRAGLGKVSMHTRRHSHGSQLLSNGTPLPVVSKRFGHASVQTIARIYAHALTSDMRASRRRCCDGGDGSANGNRTRI
ncbi:MAG: tyrosine-type recombinase/integrase [Acidobacteriota bacterium]